MSVTDVCPYVHEPEKCALFEHYEYLPKIYIEQLKVPRGAELKFPIECEYAPKYLCPYVKEYYYEPEWGEEAVAVWEPTGEVFWIPKKDIPERGRYQTPYARHGIILKEPHAKRIWLNEKSMIVKKKRLPRDIEAYNVFVLGEYA